MSSGDGDVRIVVVKKKVKADHGHHGGSWKVAYADFVTAMMAFFLVMWIMGMDPEVKDLVQGYFSNPVGFQEGRNPEGTIVPSVGPSVAGTSFMDRSRLMRSSQEARFEAAARTMEARLRDSGLVSDLDADVAISVTDEGLRVELMETGEGETFFDRASFALKPALARILEVLGSEFEKLGNPVVVEGHTDALPFTRAGYSNWELSVQRANTARRVLVAGGLDGARIQEVRGYADRELKNPDDPLDPRNRRISILLPFQADVAVLEIPAEACAGRAGGCTAAGAAGP